MADSRNRFLFAILLCGLLCLPVLVLGRGEQDSSHDNTDHSRSRGTHDRTSDNPVDDIVDTVNNIGNDIGTIQNAENAIVNFFNDSKSKFELALANLSSYLPLDINYTLTKAHECDLIKNNKEYYQTIGLILSAVLIVLGIIFSFIGYRLMKIILFLIGFLAGGSITYFIVLAFTHQLTYSWVLYVSIIVPILVGIIAGVLTICLYYVGIFLAGGSIGFLIMWFILAAIDLQFFRTHIYVPIIIAVVVAVIVGIVTLFVQKWFFIVGTTVLGSFMIVWGLDYYIELGSMIYYLILFAEHRTQINPCWYSWSMIGVFVILIGAGFLIQALVTGRKYDHKKEMKGMCCGLCNKKKRKTKKVDDGGDYVDLKEVTG